MPISGTFTANFADFDRACQKAEGELVAIQNASDKVGASVTRMVGTSAPQMDRFNATVKRAQGELVDAGIGAKDFGVSAVRAANDSVHEFAQLPGVLHEVRAGLNDAATAAGLTFENLGLVDSAGLALGAGITGWGIGRAIADFLGLDDAIARAGARLAGFGDLAKQERGAAEDVINLANRRGATLGAPIDINRGLTEAEVRAGFNLVEARRQQFEAAQKFNAQWVAEEQEFWRQMNDAAARGGAPQALANQIAAWHNELQKVRDAGTLKQLQADITSHTFTLKELADAYRVAPEAIAQLTRELANEEKAQKAAEEASKRNAVAKLREIEAIDRMHESVRRLEVIMPGLREQVGVMNDTELKAIYIWLAKAAAGEKLYETIRKLEQVKAGDIDIGNLPSGTVDTETIARLKALLGQTTRQTTDWLTALNGVSETLGRIGFTGQNAFSQIVPSIQSVLSGIEDVTRATRQAAEEMRLYKEVSLATNALVALSWFNVGSSIGTVIGQLIRAGAFSQHHHVNPNLPPVPPGAGLPPGEIPPGIATGGLVTAFGVKPFSAPSGPDSILARLAPNEIVLNPAQQRRVAGAMGGSSYTFNIDARGAWFDNYGADRLALRLQEAHWRHVSQNKGGAYTKARAALNMKV